MDKIIENLKDKVKDIILFGLIVVLIGTQIFFVFKLYEKKEVKEEIADDIVIDVKEDVEEVIEPKTFLVDIKGEVKKPGAYQVLEDKRVVDVITLAGGLTANASTLATNLSLKVKDEMVIYIFSKNEILDLNKALNEQANINDACGNNSVTSNNACLDDDSENIPALVNINEATLEELMTLPNIGEAKANSIIEYRKNTPFKTILDIMNVSGIGEAVYDQIKNLITV